MRHNIGHPIYHPIYVKKELAKNESSKGVITFNIPISSTKNIANKMQKWDEKRYNIANTMCAMHMHILFPLQIFSKVNT